VVYEVFRGVRWCLELVYVVFRGVQRCYRVFRGGWWL